VKTAGAADGRWRPVGGSPALQRCLLGAAVLTLPGCLFSEDDGRLGPLRAAIARWEAAGPESYTVREERACFCLCPRSFVVIVNGEVIAGVAEIEPYEGVDPAELEEYALSCAFTVPRLFALIAEQVDSAHRFDVEYDRNLGYPTKVAIDPAEFVADEEFFITLHDLAAATTAPSISAH
jgi:hypothetical protein